MKDTEAEGVEGPRRKGVIRRARDVMGMRILRGRNKRAELKRLRK